MVLEADGVDVAVPGRTLVAGVGFTLERGQRVAVVGPNGAGKTTLVETLIGRRAPARGRVSVGHRVEAAYFSQHGRGLRDDRTVVETVLATSDLTPTQARTLLGGFLFSGDAAEARVERLSGGERRRLELVALIARGGNLLVLDEPTNHLDTESREALESALEAFDGTVLIVSHDRALIDAVATHTLALEDGRAVLRAGGYARPAARPRGGRGRAGAPPAPPPRRPRRRRRCREATAPAPAAEVRRLEGEIARVEAGIAASRRALVDPAVLADREAVAARGEEHRALQEELVLADARVGAGRGGRGGLTPEREGLTPEREGPAGAGPSTVVVQVPRAVSSRRPPTR